MILNSNFSSLGLGTGHVASFGKGISALEASFLFEKALENNVRVIDTADTYGSGDAERLIGRAISEKRKEYFVMTKAGFPHFSLPGYLSPLNQFGKKWLQRIGTKKNFSKNYLLESLHKSLKRLNTDYVDAFFLHEPLAIELSAYPDYWEALNVIKLTGMAKYVGISTNDLEAYELAFENIPLDLVQTSIPYNGGNTETVFDSCKLNNIPVVGNQALMPRNSFLANYEIARLLKQHGCSEKDFVSILIAYGYYFKKADSVLIGTRNPSHLEDNAVSFNAFKDMDEIFGAISKLSL